MGPSSLFNRLFCFGNLINYDSHAFQNFDLAISINSLILLLLQLWSVSIVWAAKADFQTCCNCYEQNVH